jgi:Tat protein translocase TatB subunit
MFGSIGGGELMVILVIALIVFGPRKLPEIGKSVGKMLVEFRKASNDFKRTIEEEVEAEQRTPSVAQAPALTAPPQAVSQTASTPASETTAPLDPEDTPRS